MKFYHCFHTDLPDQFIEANSRHLIRWVENWRDNPYLVRSRIVDSVEIDLSGQPKREDWPTLKSRSERMIDLWMHNKGVNYNGRYWESLTEDQRSPDRKSGQAGRDDAVDAFLYAFKPGAITYAKSGKRPSLTLQDYAKLIAVAPPPPSTFLSPSILKSFWDFEEAFERPPLKREGIVAGEIIGYRCWRIEKGLLRSVYQSDAWIPGQVLEGRELGDWDSRGIHAWKDPASKQYHDYIRSYLNRGDNSPFIFGGFEDRLRSKRPVMVTGTVFLWGDVVEHERGWRAEFARVRSLDWLYPDETMMGREEEALNELRSKYRVLS